MISTLSQALSERGYDTLTPVQEAVCDPDLVTKDLLVSAQTGSGKTVGFGLAIAPTLLGDATEFGPAGTPIALVIAPTRELAFQVMRELRWLYEKAGARIASCVGGMDMRDERRALERGAHIVVGTPGRLRDHIMRGSLDMSALRAVVLDEADEMLDLGFREDLEFMLGEAPADRRTLMFSATVPPMIAKLAEQYQRDAQRINTVGGAKQHTDISYQAVRVAEQDRENAIFNLLRFHDANSAIVFANTRATVNHLMARLSNRGFSVVCLSGELSQSERTNALQAMRDGRAKVCVATDVAARGIDLPNLNLVIHADLPTNTEGLLHRSGRTGRAGRKGISALIVPPRAASKMERLLKWAKITAEWTVAPSADDIRKLDEERLLSDPVWSDEPTEDETAFAERLLAAQSPEAIAAAYLRLYRARRSAPEELLPPDTKPEKREQKAFGPSSWIALSVGRNDRAEARWLLPMLCRIGGLDKTAIGAIRVQYSETFVEISTPSLAAFLTGLGPESKLEDGVTVRTLDGPPQVSSQPAKPYSPRRDDRSRHDDGDRRPARASKPKPAPRSDATPPRAPGAEAKWSKPKPDAARPKPKFDHAKGASKPDYVTAKGKSKPKPPPNRDKPKPAASGPGARPVTKGDAKPARKPAKAGGAFADARDSSKRFTPPGKAKTAPRRGGKPAPRRAGGDQTPKRNKT